MFSDIMSTSTSRLSEVRDYINYIKDNTPRPPTITPPAIITLKGMFFVYLYGVYEFTVRETVLRSIDCLNKLNIKINDCKIILSCLILNDTFNSIATTGNGKKWDKRWELLSSFSNDINVYINPDLMPTDGKNFRYRQLQSIWTSFGIVDSILPRSEIGGRIDEIVELRNAIAHGNDTPLEIGKRFTINDLLERFDDISEYCSYIIDIFSNYLASKKYLKV